VKYYVLLPRADYVGSGLDNDQWMMLLRALSANRAFHWAYGGDVTAGKIAHFLILNPQCPRALITCVAGANNHLSRIAKLYGRDTEAQAKAAALQAMLEGETPERIFEEGLHEFLSRFIRETASLAGTVVDTYLSGDMR
ncbi:MAG: alpha-E domain-containing protein, partial [Paracoccaceae bacterium]